MKDRFQGFTTAKEYFKAGGNGNNTEEQVLYYID